MGLPAQTVVGAGGGVGECKYGTGKDGVFQRGLVLMACSSRHFSGLGFLVGLVCVVITKPVEWHRAFFPFGCLRARPEGYQCWAGSITNGRRLGIGDELRILPCARESDEKARCVSRLFLIYTASARLMFEDCCVN